VLSSPSLLLREGISVCLLGDSRVPSPPSPYSPVRSSPPPSLRRRPQAHPSPSGDELGGPPLRHVLFPSGESGFDRPASQVAPDASSIPLHFVFAWRIVVPNALCSCAEEFSN